MYLGVQILLVSFLNVPEIMQLKQFKPSTGVTQSKIADVLENCCMISTVKNQDRPQIFTP